MNERIYTFGGISLTLVVCALGYFFYSEYASKKITQNTPLNSPITTVAEIAPPAQPTTPDPMIKISTPTPNNTVQSPLSITGEARGYWFFEGSFPVTLQDEFGKTVAMGIATSTSEWMTENYIPFNATLSWASTTTPTGTLILKRDNPSGLPEHDASISIPVNF